MKVLVVGGGSGGHITPAVAVVRSVLEKKPRTRVEFWTDRKYYRNVVKITTELGVSWGEEDRLSGKRQYIRVRKIMSGKFRRYSDWKLKDYLEHPWVSFRDLVLLNFVGFVGFVSGIMQSFFRLVSKKTRPDVIFLKGGFVGLPVGIVAKLLRIPYIVHESDAVPGLANRLMMKKARVVAMGMKGFKAKDSRYVYTGVPVAPEFKKVSATKQAALKKTFGFDPEKPLVIFTGGSQGAEHINITVREILPELLKSTSVGLVAGRGRYEEMVDLKKYEVYENAKLVSNFRMWAFNSAMNELLGAADVVVSRAGATTIAELASLSKAVILIPYEKLPGAHQVRNAERLLESGACEVVPDEKMVEKPELLLETVKKLVRSPKVRSNLAEKLHETASSDAAEKLADILIDVANGEKVAFTEQAEKIDEESEKVGVDEGR